MGPSYRTARHRRRGNTLMVTVVLSAVLGVVAAGYVGRSQTVVDGIVAKRQYDTSVSCAEAGRQMLLSEFQAFGASITDLQLNTTVGDRRYASGHYDQFNIKSVVDQGGGSGGSGGGVGTSDVVVADLTNRITGIGTAAPDGGSGSSGIRSNTGGTPYRFTVVCSDSTGQSRQAEVEYLIRYGF